MEWKLRDRITLCGIRKGASTTGGKEANCWLSKRKEKIRAYEYNTFAQTHLKHILVLGHRGFCCHVNGTEVCIGQQFSLLTGCNHFMTTMVSLDTGNTL